MIDAEIILSALPLALLVVDKTNTLRWLNPAAEDWLKTSARVASGEPLTRFLILDDTLQSLVSRIRAEGGSVSEYQRSVHLFDGRHSPVNIHIASLGDGDLLLAVARLRKISQAARQEEVEDIFRSSGLMAAMLAHEVKNPLSGIRGAAQLLKSGASSENTALLQLICDEVDRIAGVLKRVEPFADSPALPSEPVNVHEALHYVQSVAEAGFARGLHFRQDFDPSLPPARTRRDELVQILFNLVKNAAEALEESDTREIRLATAYSFVPLLPVAVMVEDSGPGIPEHLRAHLFEPFASGKGAGRGLGLAIAAKLAKDISGQLTLEESRPGRTRFKLLLPAA